MRPVCARFFNDLSLLYIRGVHGQAAGRTFYEPVRLDGAQNKTLISNTATFRQCITVTVYILVIKV